MINHEFRLPDKDVSNYLFNVKQGLFTKKIKAYQDGKRLHGKKTDEYYSFIATSKQRELRIYPGLLRSKAWFDGAFFDFQPKLKPSEIVLAHLPVLNFLLIPHYFSLIFIIPAFLLNFYIIRSGKKQSVKILLVIITSIVSTLLLLMVFAFLFAYALKRGIQSGLL